MSNNQNKVHEVFPYLRVNDAPAAIAFYIDVFGATERFRLTEPSGRIGHVELDLGNIVLMLSDEFPEYNLLGPQTPGTTGMMIHLHCENCDELATRAVGSGAVILRQSSDAFNGERSCTIRDPFGYEWMLGHEIEKVDPVEMQRRYTAMLEES